MEKDSSALVTVPPIIMVNARATTSTLVVLVLLAHAKPFHDSYSLEARVLTLRLGHMQTRFVVIQF